MFSRLAKNRLVSDSLILMGVQITGYVLPMITLPYLTRVLGPDNFGLLALGTALVLYFVMLVDYGFSVIGPRRIAIATGEDEVSRVYSTIISCRLGLTLISILVLAVMTIAVPGIGAYKALYWLSFLQVLGWGMSPNWLLQGLQKMRYVAFSDYGAKILSVLLIFLLVRNQSDYLAAAALQSGGFFMAACLGLGMVYFLFPIRLVRPTKAGMREMMIAGWPVFLSLASLTMMTSTNIMILGALAPKADVGYFSAAQRLIIAARSLLNPASSTIYPHMSRLAAESPPRALQFLKKVFLWVSLPFLALSIAMLLFSPLLTTMLYGRSFEEAGTLLRIMALSPFVLSMGNTLGTQYLLAFGFEQAWSRINIRTVVMNFVFLGLALLVMRPVRAVALTTLLTDCFATGSCLLFYLKTSKEVAARLPNSSQLQG
jgi:polysaccharide transporter, PST family